MTTEALSHIIRQRKFIQRELGRKIKLKFTPVITYKPDDTEERVSHINRIIDEANAS
jgi:ribosome-binding factor A